MKNMRYKEKARKKIEETLKQQTCDKNEKEIYSETEDEADMI